VKIELKEITVQQLTTGYQNNDELGVVAYSGALDVRPPYQREFVYRDRQRDAVIDTVTRGFPLNVMYWSVGGNDRFEVIDGQQRTISICEFVVGEFAMRVGSTEQPRYFHNLHDDEKQQVLNYKLMVYLCSGTDSEKLDWFRTINIAGEELTAQELRNAVYSGPWVASAKPYFSKNGCPAYSIGSNYMRGSPIRQDYLETAVNWISNGDISGYMASHQHDPNANQLWAYFQNVMNWVKLTFPSYFKEMRGVPWGALFNEFGHETFDTAKLEADVNRLMEDVDVTKKSGIFEYVLNKNERALSIRAFDGNMKREAYQRQGRRCVACGEEFEIEQMEGDHITPWHEGGKTIAANCQMLCKEDNRRKGGK